jgi:hypothetical protein
MAPRITQEQIEQIVARSLPERLSEPGKRPIPADHAAHVVQLVGWGQTALAADHLLFPELTGALPAVAGGVVRQLHLAFIGAQRRADDSAQETARKVRRRQFCYEALLETAINFAGAESRWLDPGERSRAAAGIRAALAEWEAIEAAEGAGSVAVAVVRRFLGRMTLVQKGISMVAKTAGRIEQGLDLGKPVLLEFLDRARREIEANVYTRMVREGYCRFGNDYALGLRWLRHLGFEQVSTNPVLAALAYSDDPSLAELFRAEVRHHPRLAAWQARPQAHADEIALFATLLALWDNLHVYRPIFFLLAEESGGGVVSFQLNPNIAHLVHESVRDVFAAFAAATEDLRVYDEFLLAGYRATRERARPNMVIKVAACAPAAREIARTINGLGFGSNITVIYTVAQEVTMVLEELAGMAAAIRKGVQPTQLYMTNMGGRFESHLREVTLERLFAELHATVGEADALARVQHLAEANGTTAVVKAAKGYPAKVAAATRYASQRTIDGHVVAALSPVASPAELQAWEDAIGKSGTLVARRVWSIFWSEQNRDRWAAYLSRTHGITVEQARFILGRVCYLPASKRKPQDTYWTLTGTGMVHTEFPNHQENVRKMAEAPGFALEGCRETITHGFLDEVADRLNCIPDFRVGYELNPELSRVLRDAGIPGEFGTGGHTAEQWTDFGSVQKTVAEFTAAYDKFRADMLARFSSAVEAPRAARRATRTAVRPAVKAAQAARGGAKPAGRRPAAAKITKAAARKRGRR